MKTGDKVKYHAIAGDTYDAVVTGVRTVVDNNTYVDIDVLIPGVSRPWPVKYVRRDRVEPVS